MTFAKDIKAAREAARLTQAEAAGLFGISPKKLWNWEQQNGKEPSRAEQVGALELLRKAQNVPQADS